MDEEEEALEPFTEEEMEGEEDEEFEPLTKKEMEDFKNEVWHGYAIGELNEAEAANMILHEAYLNGLLE